MSLRLAVIASALWLWSLAPAPGPAAGEPPLTSIAQDRWLYVSATSGAYSQTEFLEAPDLGLFREWIGTYAGGGAASAEQTSWIQDDGICSQGEVGAGGFDLGSGSSSGGSSLAVRFTLQAPVSYRAWGALTAIAGLGYAGAGVELRRTDLTPVFAFEASVANPNVAIDEFGMLPPGDYVLEAFAGASGLGQFGSAGATYELRFEVESSAGAEALGARSSGFPVGLQRSLRE